MQRRCSSTTRWKPARTVPGDLATPLDALDLVLRPSEVIVAADETEIAIVEALRYVVDWLIYPVRLLRSRAGGNLLDRFPRYIAALNWINLPEMIVLFGRAKLIASIMPVSLAVILQLGLEASVLLLVPDRHVHDPQHQLADHDRADDRQLVLVALAVIRRHDFLGVGVVGT